MQRGWALLALLLLVPAAQGDVALGYAKSDLALGLAGPLPVTLAAGPAGSTTLGANATSASSSVTASIITASTFNTTSLRNTGEVALRVRLVLSGTTALTGECVRCELTLRHGGSTWNGIAVANGAVTRSTGDWVTLQSGATAPSVVWLHATAQGSVVSDKWQTLAYVVEIEPAGGGSPTATYTTLSTAYRV